MSNVREQNEEPKSGDITKFLILTKKIHVTWSFAFLFHVRVIRTDPEYTF